MTGEEITVCPVCDSSQISPTNTNPCGEATAAAWTCRCGASFDEPKRRERIVSQPRYTCSAAANALIDTDPDEVGL